MECDFMVFNSSDMGAQKHGSKSSSGGYVGGLLQLFDWNVKSRKKLFASNSDVPDGFKQGKKHDSNLPATRFHLIEDEIGGLSSVRGGSEYSCASSVTDEDGSRAPGVVARLMGLESLPTSGANGPYTTPSFDSRSLQDSYYHKSNAEFLNDYRAMYSHHQPYKVNDRKEIVEPKLPRFPGRPIDRFQSESLPPKTSKPVSLTHHKLLSPIKSPGFISPKSAAHIMEAAAKILDPALHAVPRGKNSSFGSSSVPNKVRDLRENVALSSRSQTKISEASRRPVDSNASKLLKGQSLTKSWNGPDETPVSKASPEVNDQFLAESKNKGRSVSLAVQAKVNVLKREGLNSSNKIVVPQKDDHEQRPKQSFRSQRNTVKNEQSKPSSVSVLRQNNRKQNCVVIKDKLGSKSSGSSQQMKKVNCSDLSSGQCKSLVKGYANSNAGFKKDCNDVSGSEKMDASSSRSKHFPWKKRAIGSDISDKANIVNTNMVDRNDKRRQPHLAINEHSNVGEDVGKRGMDVVSFTFTSPMNKSSSQSPDWKAEKHENFCYVSPRSEKNSSISKGKKISSLGLNVIGGDALSILLEQKLRELTSEIESSSSNSAKAGSTSMCILQDLVSAFNSASTNHSEFDGRPFPPEKNKTGVEFNSIFISPDPQAHETNTKLQYAKETVVDNSFIDTIKEDQYQRPSPVSILDASFSSESCHSSEGIEIASGCMENSVEANLDISVTSKDPLLSSVDYAELSDSASSSGQCARNELGSSKYQVALPNSEYQPLDYIKLVAVEAKATIENFLLGRSDEMLDSSVFDKLENEGDGTHDNRLRLVRRALFDCVCECLNIQYGHHVEGGYGAWSKGMVVLRSSDRLAQEIYKEISEWKNMSEWMVDELVDKDMSSHLGKWTNFDIEGFELGVEIEKAILSSLIDEAVADVLV